MDKLYNVKYTTIDNGQIHQQESISLIKILQKLKFSRFNLYNTFSAQRKITSVIQNLVIL